MSTYKHLIHNMEPWKQWPYFHAVWLVSYYPSKLSTAITVIGVTVSEVNQDSVAEEGGKNSFILWLQYLGLAIVDISHITVELQFYCKLQTKPFGKVCFR